MNTKRTFLLAIISIFAQAARVSYAQGNVEHPQPFPGGLEELERTADLIFKGQVSSIAAVTNSFFPSWANTHAAHFNLISVLKGHIGTNAPVFWYVTEQPGAWGGSLPPSPHQLETGETFLVCAAALNKREYLYSVPPDATNRPYEFRQLYRDGVTRCLDNRPLTATSFKTADWLELNLLLRDTNPTNQAYAITELDRLSLTGRP
ncbi:MAG TPA: hypothetical protein VLT36_09680, partial [Candidatus Dormibacteraeota bacterium]|nr:hypothetical protein [Candidatus Dormibacteraeota bacterium]